MIDVLTVEGLMLLCRKHGVLQFQGYGVSFTFGTVEPATSPLANEPEDVAASEPAAQPGAPVKSPRKLGADGLTAEQQEELFGRPMDAKG